MPKGAYLHKQTPVEPRFWAKVRSAEDVNLCWEWTGSKLKGYGQIRVACRTRYAHRWAYERFVGPIPDGLELDHLCRNPGCVNPAHLEPVTHRVNMLRGETVGARHAAVTACPAGHPYDEANTGRTASGGRRCLACHRERERGRKRRRAA